MGAIETKTFIVDGAVAVALPFDKDFTEGTTVRIEKIDGQLHISAIESPDPVEQKRKLIEMVDRIQAAWGDTPRPRFDPGERLEFPDRPGLY